MVPELGELVEDDVGGIALELGAAVVDLLDVALGAGRPDDVGGIGHPALQPGEAFPAHAFGEHRHAPAAHDPADRDATPAVVAGRRPHGALGRRVELPGDEARGEAAEGGQHLVRGDHREAVAEGHDDRRVDAGERLWEHDVLGDADAGPPGPVVAPVDAEQVARIGRVGVDGGEARRHRRGDALRVGQFGEGRHDDPRLAESPHRPLVCGGVDQFALKPELLHRVLHSSSSRFHGREHSALEPRLRADTYASREESFRAPSGSRTCRLPSRDRKDAEPREQRPPRSLARHHSHRRMVADPHLDRRGREAGEAILTDGHISGV